MFLSETSPNKLKGSYTVNWSLIDEDLDHGFKRKCRQLKINRQIIAETIKLAKQTLREMGED